jgi:integrase
MRPYDLRHSFALLLIAECRSVVQVADQRGHALTLTLNVYATSSASSPAESTAPAEQLIAEARANFRAKFAQAL